MHTHVCICVFVRLLLHNLIILFKKKPKKLKSKITISQIVQLWTNIIYILYILRIYIYICDSIFSMDVHS